MLISVKKIVKKVKKFFPNTNVIFSSHIAWKDKKYIARKIDKTGKRLRNYFHPKNIDHLGRKNLHLNMVGNSLVAKNISKYLKDYFWNDTFLRCAVKSDEYKLGILSTLPNVLSIGNIKEGLWKKFKTYNTQPFKY